MVIKLESLQVSYIYHCYHSTVQKKHTDYHECPVAYWASIYKFTEIPTRIFISVHAHLSNNLFELKSNKWRVDIAFCVAFHEQQGIFQQFIWHRSAMLGICWLLKFLEKIRNNR